MKTDICKKCIEVDWLSSGFISQHFRLAYVQIAKSLNLRWFLILRLNSSLLYKNPFGILSNTWFIVFSVRAMKLFFILQLKSLFSNTLNRDNTCSSPLSAFCADFLYTVLTIKEFSQLRALQMIIQYRRFTSSMYFYTIFNLFLFPVHLDSKS